MNKLAYLFSLLLCSSAIVAEDKDAVVALDAPAPADMTDIDPKAPGGDDISNPSPVSPDQDKVESAESTETPVQTSETVAKPATIHEKFDMAVSNMRATHPEEAEKFEKAYHASKDKEAVLAQWSHTTIESQDMLDAVDELHAIYQVMKNISPESSLEFQDRVRDEKDPRNLLEYAHQLLLKALKDRKTQIEMAKEELSAVTTILQYVDIDAAKEVFKSEQTAEDPRTRMSEAYDILLESLEKAHKEAGVAPLN